MTTIGPIRPEKKTRGTRPSPDDVQRLYNAGEGRNAIARTLGVSQRQVSRVAADLGISWDQEASRDAAAARRAAAELDRADLAQRFRELALDSVDRAIKEDDPTDRRRLAMTAESASRSDLALHAANRDVEHSSSAAEDFSELLDSIRNGFDELDDMPVDQLDPDDDD